MKIITLFATVVAVGALAPSAAADQPGREDLPPTPPHVSIRCGFPVLLEGVDEKAKVLDFGDHRIVTGQLKWRLTNLESGTSIEVNISGPVHSALTQDGTGFVTRFEGPTLFTIGPVLSSRTGIAQGIYVSTGLVVVEGTFADGIMSITQVGGTWTNLCDALV